MDVCKGLISAVTRAGTGGWLRFLRILIIDHYGWGLTDTVRENLRTAWLRATRRVSREGSAVARRTPTTHWQLPLICAANPVWCTDGATMAAHRSSWVEGRPIADDP